MEQNLENLKQQTLKELTSLTDKVSKIQQKIYKKEKPEPIVDEYGIAKKITIAHEITPKTMANISALESALDFYQEKGQTALENVKKSRFLSGDYFKNYSISRNCKKVVSTIQKMIDSVKVFNAEKEKISPKKTETKSQEIQNEIAQPVEQNTSKAKVQDSEPAIPVKDDEFVNNAKQNTQNLENEKVLSKDNSSTSDKKVQATNNKNKSNETSKDNVSTIKTNQINSNEINNEENEDKLDNKNNDEKVADDEVQKENTNSIAIDEEELAKEPTDAIEAVKNIDESEFGEPDYNVMEDTSDEYDLPKIAVDPNKVKENNSASKTQQAKIVPVSKPKAKKDDSKKQSILTDKTNVVKPVQVVETTKVKEPETKNVSSSTALVPVQKTMLPVVISPEKPSILDEINSKYFKNIFKLLNTTIVIGNKNQYNSLENLEYELSNANLETMQNLGFPVLDDPQKADLIKNVMLKFVKMSKEIRKDQWLSSLNSNKKGTFEARKHTNQEAIVDRNLKLIKELNINPKLAQEYGLSLSVDELEQTIKDEKAEVRKELKKVASENNRDINFINFYNTFKNIHILGNAKDGNSLYYLYNDLTSENNSFGLTGESLVVALNLVKQEIISTRNSKQSKTNTTQSSEKEENASTDALGK